MTILLRVSEKKEKINVKCISSLFQWKSKFNFFHISDEIIRINEISPDFFTYLVYIYIQTFSLNIISNIWDRYCGTLFVYIKSSVFKHDYFTDRVL